MALDGFVTRAIVHDLKRSIGARIHKIHQPTDHDLVFSIRGAGMAGKLLLSANPTYPRVHWTTSSYSNPLEAPMFCMLLRKYCEGGVIEQIAQVGLERIIHIDIRHRDEIGDLSAKRLVIELMGRHSNIILMDPATGQIHDGIHHVTPAVSTYRIVMPGSLYTPPPEQNKADPLSIQTKEQWITAISNTNEHLQSEDSPVTEKHLVSSFSGMSPLLAKEIIFRSITGEYENRLSSEHVPMILGNHMETDQYDLLWNSFQHVMVQMQQQKFTPNIVIDSKTEKHYFSITKLTHIQGTDISFEQISPCLEHFYGDKAERDTVKQRASDLIRFVQNEKAKNVTKLSKLKQTLEDSKDADKYRILGELLTAYMHQMQRGDTSIEVLNYYDENQQMIRIDLDPQLTPSDNAQQYFKKYNKKKNSTVVVVEQMTRTEKEIIYFDTLLQQLESASLMDIEEIREELVAQQYLRERVKKGARRKKSNKPSLLCYTSAEGIEIYVGKNNTQNDYLTNKLASTNDTWLHTKDIPGSHVVIRAQQFGNSTLEEAAMLAAHYSQAKGSSLIPVDYTLIRHVHKPSGAKPGFVIYDHQKTVFITPDEQKIKSMPYVIK